MKFTKMSRYHWLSDCGLYSISATQIDGKWAYTAWFVKPKVVTQCLGVSNSPDEAKEFCDKHNEKEASNVSR